MRASATALLVSLTLAFVAAFPNRAPAQAASAAQAAAAKATVSVDTSAGYARILFTFERPTPVAATVADGVLMIRLGSPLDTTIDAFTEKLAPYVSSGRRDDDGLTYRFALTNPVALHSSTQVNKTAVDLVPDGFSGVPPDLPPPPPPPPKPALPDVRTLSTVKVQVGEYANFTRLVFDWPQPVPYSVFPGHGRISVRFEALARPDFSALQSRSSAWVKSAGWRLDGTATVVDFETDPDSAFHDFQDGAKIAIDVLAPRTDASAYVPPSIGAGGSALVPIAPSPTQAPAALRNPPPKGSDAAVVLGPTLPAAPARAQPPQPSPARVLAPSAELTREGSVLHFPQGRGHAVAVFVRGETMWILLDNHPALDAPTLLAPLAAVLVKADTNQLSGAAILKLAFKTPLLATVSESDVALNVTLSAGTATPADPIALTRQGADGQTTLTTPLPGATRVIALADPDAGDRLLVVPARPGKAMLTPKRFVELEALASAAGLVAIPYTDDFSVQVQSEIVTFSRPQGLALSAASGANVEPVVQMQQSQEGPAFIDFAQWGRDLNDTVFAAERSLRTAIARLPESESNRARLQFARYLLAQDLAPEALGVIQIIQAADPRFASDPGLTAMRGVAQYMMGRYADARLSLSFGPLAGDPHASLWRGMAEAKLGDYGNARRDLLVSQGVLRLYPAAWQSRARLARAETGLAQGDLASVNDALDQLSSNLSPRDSVEGRLYAAELLAAQGHLNEAIARLSGLEKTDYVPVAARATYARVDAQLAVKKIKPNDAIEALEKLRFRWRGDDLELKTLRKLGSLYFADNRWREGLMTLRIAADYFPNAELAREAQDDMRRAFNDLFLGAKADTMPPIQALGLFYDFTELTPIGRDGDEMIRRLTDRLMAVDLLGPAEQLLDHQVSQRLDGVARAAVATKLAMIYLLDHKPAQALKTLNDTRQTRLPDDVTLQRRIFEARALAGLKRYDAAIDLVSEDESPEAKRLRADIYWDAGNWAIAGAKMEEILGERWNGTSALSDVERSLIMRAAVAYSLGNDEASLAKLKAHYAEKMTAGPDAKAFAVVSERIDRQGVAFRDLAKRIASIDSLQAFMADFKKQSAATAPKTASN